MHMSKTRPGRAPPLPRGQWCAPDRRLSSGRHPPLLRGQSLRPRLNIPSAGVTFTRRHQGFTHVRPSPRTAGRRPGPGSSSASRQSSPRPRPPDGTGAASASTPGFAPRSHPRRTPRRRQAIAHWPEYYTFDISRTSKRCLPLHSCTLTSHVVRRRLHPHPGHPGRGTGPPSPAASGSSSDRSGPPASSGPAWCHWAPAHTTPPPPCRYPALRPARRSPRGLPSRVTLAPPARP